MLKKLLLPSLLLLTLLLVGWLRFSPVPSEPVDHSPDENAARPLTSSPAAHGASGSKPDASPHDTEPSPKDETVSAVDQAQPSQTAETGTSDAAELNLTGLVTNQDGQPLPGVRVYCKYATDSPSMTQSEADGAFQLKLPFKDSGVLLIFAQKEGYALYWSTKTTTEPSLQLDITLKASDTPSYGKVMDENNFPLEDVTISIPQNAMGMFEIPLAKTGRDGRFQVVLSPYFRILQFSKTGYQTRIEVQSSRENDELIVVLRRPTTQEGLVIDKDNGEPVPKFALWIAGDDDAAPQWLEFEDPDGRFSIPNLALGSPHQITVTADGFLPGHVRDFLPEPDAPRVIALNRVRANFKGRVVDSSSNPVSGVAVKMTGFPDWVGRRHMTPQSFLTRDQEEGQGRLGLTFTDDEGYFELTPIPSGYDVELEMSKPGYATHYWPYLSPHTLQKNGEQNWTLFREAAVRVTLDRDEFSGEIHLYLNTTPIHDPDQPIMKDRYASVTIDPYEADYLFTALPPGRYHLRANTSGTLLADEDLDLKEGDLREIMLTDLYQIQGAAFMNQQPLAGGTVYLHQQTQKQWRSSRAFKTTHTDAAGRFSFDEIPSGDYRLFATPGHTSYDQNPYVQSHGLPVHVDQDDVSDSYDFRRGGSLRVQFKGLSPQNPVASTDQHESRPMILAKDGAYVARDLAPGQYMITEAEDHRGQFPLVEKVVMPEDGSDVDLGVIDGDDKGSLRVTFHGDLVKTNFSIILTREDRELMYRNDLDFTTDLTIPDITAGQILVALHAYKSSIELSLGDQILEPFGFEVTINPGTETALDIGVRAFVGGQILTPRSWDVKAVSLAGEAAIEVLEILDGKTTRGQYLTFYHPDQDSLNGGYTKIGEAPEGSYHVTIDYINPAGEPRQAQQTVQLIAGEYVRLQFDD